MFNRDLIAYGLVTKNMRLMELVSTQLSVMENEAPQNDWNGTENNNILPRKHRAKR